MTRHASPNPPGHNPRRPARIRSGGLFFLLPFAVAAAPSPLEQVQSAATEWVKLRNETARLETQWRTERSLLESTVRSLEERAGQQADKRDQVKARTAKDREELDGLRDKAKAASAELADAEKRLQALSGRLADLRPRLPPRLNEALEMSYRSLANPKLPVGERMNHATTILSRCAQFNQTVTAAEEVLSLEAGRPARLHATIYWGLAQGYAIDRTGGAWIGAPGRERWEWIARPEAAATIERLIAIHAGKTDPDFVNIPAQLAQVEGSK